MSSEGASLGLSRPVDAATREAVICSARMRSASVPLLVGRDFAGRRRARRVPLAGRRQAESRPPRREHGVDRRARAFERRGEAGDLGGDVVDALAQERVLDPLGRPGRLRPRASSCHLALQLGALLDGRRQVAPSSWAISSGMRWPRCAFAGIRHSRRADRLPPCGPLGFAAQASIS